MNDILYQDPITDKVYPAWLSTAVDELIYKVRHKSIWQVVDFCLKIWETKYPEEHKRYIQEMARYKNNRLNKFASTESKSLREIISLPREVNYLLDKLASDKIADYGPKKFWLEFARRYPKLSPAEKI
jgi:hypothetical protein